MASSTVTARQYNAQGYLKKITEVTVNRSTLRGRPTGNVHLFYTYAGHEVHLEITPDDWDKLNQAAKTAEHEQHEVPHCRHHPQFRSDCNQCVREREYG